MNHLHIVARTRNLSVGEVLGVCIFNNDTEHFEALLDAAKNGKVPTVLLTVKRQGEQYKSYLFTWPAFLEHRVVGRTGASRLLVNDESLMHYRRDDRIVKTY